MPRRIVSPPGKAGAERRGLRASYQSPASRALQIRTDAHQASRTELWRRTASRRVNRYVELIWELRRLAETENIPEDSPLRRRIADEYARCADEAMLAIDVTVIKRTPLPGDDISHEIDFSPDRIQALIDRGARDAEVIADHLRQRHTRDTVRSGRYGETASPRAT